MEQKMLRILQNCKNIRELKQTHLQIFIHGLQHSDFMLPKLITVSSAFNLLDYATHKEALRVYSRMKALMVEANSFTFTFLLKCFETSQALEDGRVIHGEILKLGFGSSVFVQNSLLGFYANCSENLGSAYRVFEEMPERDVISWNSMISAYMTRGEIQSAIGLLDKMPERNIVTWNSVVCGLSKAGNMELAHSVFEQMPLRNELPEKTVVSWTAMISGYATNGDLKSAENIFNHMPVKNVVSWNAMISGYVHNHEFDQALCVFHHMLINGLAVNGKCREAINLFDKMCLEGTKPDDVIFIAVLSACTHGGLVEEGKLEEAVRFTARMHLKPNAVIWATLLFCCKIHGNGDLLNSMTEKIMDQEPSNPSYLTLVSNLSASFGRWEDVLSFRVAMRQQRMEKVPGCSSIQVGNRVMNF
ncbi:Pentatricopeptide repeat-containing protein [Vitis vinifera]|uniref:Pentatricopeptide repeat-containing protein n=1 Tax=Vitis vinifera TaxID=29760 RepID=A0A438DAU3_VITVI|nr:Pentatricopeptide repeat-containing protein [Vitis vinifera]